MERNNRHDVFMEDRIHNGSSRLKSKVPRARFAPRFGGEFGEVPSFESRNGVLRSHASSISSNLLGMNSGAPPVSPCQGDTDETKEWQKLLGERVCISGVKQGILRYYGRTNFAQGHWCGVELDEPVGKNNGTVNGVIYFHCKPNHGIFAPVSKVSKLNDLSGSGCDCRAELKQESHTQPQNLDYNVRYIPETTYHERKYIRTSRSDPTFLMNTARTILPHNSESFPYDKRSITVEKETSVFTTKNKAKNESVLSYEISGHRDRSGSDVHTNIIANPLTSCLLSKYGYGAKNQQFFSSKTGRLKGDEVELSDVVKTSSFFRQQDSSKRTASLHSGLNHGSLPSSSSFSAAKEEFESYFKKTASSSCGKVSPPSEPKHYSGMQFLEEYRVSNSFFSHEDEELLLVDDDDQISMDCDESLGILTPNQMKDFTLLADTPGPTTCSDIRGVDFPSSESFDDINDLPEDEQVHDVSVQYLPESASAIPSLEVTKQNLVQNSNIVRAEAGNVERHSLVSSTDKFLFSISAKDFADFNVDEHYSPMKKSVMVVDSPQGIAPKVYNSFNMNNVLKSNLTTKIDKQLVSKFGLESKVFATSNSEEASISTYGAPSSDAKIGDSVFSHYSSQDSNPEANLPKGDCFASGSADLNLSDNKKIRMISMECADEKSRKSHYDTDSSRDSLLQADQEHTASKEKLTVSWEDCVAHSNDSVFGAVERPDSVYTVASNDTGYQEEYGEFDADAAVVMATSVESTEDSKRFSTASRDSCIVTEDVDGYKIAESNSTSGYSTGLSDSCCNDRHDDDSGSCKPLTDESIQDSVGPCDSEDAFSLHETVSVLKDTVVEVSDVTDTETALFVDSTSDALCETMVGDSTLTEIHELLMSPDDNPPALPSPTDKDSEMDHEEAKVEDKSSCEAVEKVVPVESCKSTPEKKVTNVSPAGLNNRSRSSAKIEIQRNQRSVVQANNAANRSKKPPTEDLKKQIVKSPKKNVMSKIKAMIEATSCKTVVNKNTKSEETPPRRTISAPKKSRWEAVTSKIAASLAEEKTKPKVKRDIKSKVDTNLSLARQQVTCKSPHLDSPRMSIREGSMSPPTSVSSRDRRALMDRNSAPSSLKEDRDRSGDTKSDQRSPRPGKPSGNSRSTSPVAASESSTNSVSLNSHTSKSKIAQWKGSNSTVESSAVPAVVPPKKPATTSAPRIKPALQSTTTTRATPPTRMVTKRTPVVHKPRPLLAAPNSHVRSLSPSGASTTRGDTVRVSPNYQQAKPSKEHGSSKGVHHPAPKPVRPPMWLSKAELSQEIQHLGNLCEARTKELNRLKMETKHITVGFDAFAALFKYMVEDLNALSVPKLVEDLEKTLKQLELTKQDLAYYEKEVEELKAHHCHELTELSDKLYAAYQAQVAELNANHEAELNRIKADQQKQIENLSNTFNVSSENTKLQHEKLITSLEQELIKQREELQMFQESEIKDLEEKHEASTKALQSHIEQLQKKCAELKQHSINMDDAMQKDTDSKLQWVASRKMDLEKEVESLKAVLEMKNKELHTLRVQNLEMDKQLEDLPLAREKIKMLQARAEDLEALMDAKTKLERKLSTENQVIRETYERESKVNRRLSMENEELQWRLRQAEHSLISDSLTEDAAEENEGSETPTTPPPHVVSRSVFFTFVDKDDMDCNSPQSPGSQYKKINRSFSANYKTSPGKTFKSHSSTTSPRKTKSHSEPPPLSSDSLIRKVSKQPLTRTTRTYQKRQRCESDNGQLPSGSEVITTVGDSFLSVEESMASSASSESSVFEQKERLLEVHKDQIMVSLDILREQRSMEDAMDETGSPCDTEKNWNSENSKVVGHSETEEMSQSGDFTDPKTYYHMTFPVLRESGADCDMDDNKTSNEESPVKDSPTDIKHSILDSDIPVINEEHQYENNVATTSNTNHVICHDTLGNAAISQVDDSFSAALSVKGSNCTSTPKPEDKQQHRW